MHVVSVYLITAILFGCHGNVPWQIGKWGRDPSSAHNALSVGEKFRKSVQYIQTYSIKYAETRREHSNVLCRNYWTYLKILQDLARLVALFNHAYTCTQRYPIPFLNARGRATSEGGRFWRCQMLQNKLVTIAASLGLPQNLCQFCNPHTCDYLCWNADEDRPGSCLRIDWVEQGLTSHQTHYRSYRGRVLWVKRPNQQCQSTEGREVLRTRLQSH